MNIKLTKFIALAALTVGSSLQSIAQTTLSNEDYSKALWMTTRFYGGQRSTDINHAEQQDNWLIQDYKPDDVPESKRGISFAQDADGGYDLTGGWFDCGDHVFFGQTGFYAGYALLKSYDAFPEGFDDFYDEAYTGYRSNNNYSWEGEKGNPNGIPDILDEVKHQTDFFIKCARSSTQFYYEKGDGDADHTQRVTSVKMQTNSVNTGGEARVMWDNPNGASMASMCGGALALMSRMYRPFDEAYADLCLVHAKYAYDYAKSKSGAVGAASGSFYGANDNWQNGYGILVAELYMATGTNSYKTEMLAMSTGSGNDGDVHPNAGYTFDYSNTGELALYTLAEAGHPDALDDFNTRISSSFINGTNYNGIGIYENGGSWGKLRYVGNAAFLVALHAKINGTALDQKVYDNIDYLLGDNSGQQSYIGGYEPNGIANVDFPTQIHHRNVYLYEGNDNGENVAYPTKNIQNGALVGGSLDGTYNNTWDDYVNTEVCVDYNVGVVGGLAAINEIKNPVDTNKFLIPCSQPELGNEVSLCGVGNVTLDANVSPDGTETYQWFKDDVSQSSPNSSTNTFSVSEAGTWKVVIDSLGLCQRTSEVVVKDILPTIDLGEDITLCSPAVAVLDASVTGNGINYTWNIDNNEIVDEESSTYTATIAGTYSVEISANGCDSQTDEIIITSILPETQGDVFCEATNSNAQLLVLSEGGPFQWFENETGGNAVYEGDFFEITPTESATYYVKDAGSFETNLGPTSTSGTNTNWGEKGYSDNFWVEFDLSENFTLESLKVPYQQIYNSHTAVVEVEIRDVNGDLMGSFVSEPKDLTSADGGNLIEFTFTDFNVLSSWGSTLRMALNTNGTTVAGQLDWDKDGSFSFPYTTASGGISITSVNSGGQSGNNYIYFYDWLISSGSDCDRAAVEVVEDCTVGLFGHEEVTIATLYPNPATETSLLKTEGEANVRILDLSGHVMDEYTFDGTTYIGEALAQGMYFIQISQGENIQTMKFIKK